MGKLLAWLLVAGKMGKMLTTGGTMLLSMLAYSWIFGWRYAVGFVLLIFVHEMGHYLAARRYKMRVTLPYFIPVPFFLGTLGAFIQMKSPVPNRRALFDVGIAGPLSGLVVAVPLLLWGLSQSTVVPIPEEGSSLLNFEALDPKASLMLTLLGCGQLFFGAFPR